MRCTSVDLTIEGVLADPVIGAAMRADRVDPRGFETMLRTTAQRLESRDGSSVLAALAERARTVAAGSCRPW